MKKNILDLCGICTWVAIIAVFSFPAAARADEDWKGKSNPYGVTLGGLAGVGNIESLTGVAVVGTISKSLLDRGFVPDLNDSLDLEAQLGPVFNSGNTGVIYSLHLRWDFVKDDVWTFYALGGLGGSVRKSDLTDSTRFLIFPRFGMGTMIRINDLVSLRGELSHELIGIGVTLFFL